MSRHASLDAEFVPPALLDPRPDMPRNDPCWCHSGKKWKHCHRDRELQQAQPIGKHFHNLRKANARHYCSHPEGGSGCGRVIASHTIQRRGGLSEIAENGHVYSVKDAFSRLPENKGALIPPLVGCKSASTFGGFCGVHDSEMFRPVETGDGPITIDVPFLLSFRAVAMEAYAKREFIAATPFRRTADYGQPFVVQAQIQTEIALQVAGAERAVSQLSEFKSEYDQAFITRDYSGFRACAVEFDSVLPVASSGAFFPDVDLQGNQLQIISRGSARHELLSTTLTPIRGRTVLTFGWFGASDGPAGQFVDSFLAVNRTDQANASVHLMFEYIENTFMRRSWWEHLDNRTKNKVLAHVVSGIGASTREAGAKLDLTPTLAQSGVARETRWGD